MNLLDDLLAAAGPVPDISPDALRDGRAALDVALAASAAEAGRKPGNRRSGLRAKALTGTPASPALREALFKIAASVHGVKVRGHYTDSLGRSGTALQLGFYTMVVDPVSGLVLDETPGSGSSTIMYITEGPAASEPKLAG